MSPRSHSLRPLPEAAAADRATVAVCVRVCAQAGPTRLSADLSVLNYVAPWSHKPIICPFSACSERAQDSHIFRVT